MGCDLSSDDTADINPKVTPIRRHLTETKKQKVLAFIEKDDLLSMATTMQQERIYPNSEISDSGMQWMLIHICCRWDSPHCLQYLLKEYFSLNSSRYIDFVNAPTIEGYTCLHLCATYKADRCFGLLMQYGGLNLKALDKMRKTPRQTALDYKSKKISETLQQFKDLNVDFLQINTEKLVSGSLLEDNPSTKDSEEKYDYKIDKNLYGVTGNLFDYSEKQKKIAEQRAQAQLEKERIVAEKLRKKEEERKRREEEKKKEKERKEEQRRKKQEEEAKKAEEQQAANLLMGQMLIAGLIQEIEAEQEMWKDESEEDSWSDEDEDEEDKNLTKTLRVEEDKLKKFEEEMKKIQEERMQAFKDEQIKKSRQVVITKEVQLLKREEDKNIYLRNRAEQMKPMAPPQVPKIQEKRLAPQSSVTGSIPPEIQRLYEDAKKQGKFIDREFPAQNSTIGDSSKSNYQGLVNNLVWLRPAQFLKGQYKLFDGIDPNDIKQGSLGVCYMLATISALAANPKNIQKIFVFHDLQVGFYVLKLYINGVPKHLVLDDLIPCNKMSKTPLFTKPIGNEVWVLLLEKAWAKAVGNYLSAQAMTPDHMMEDLSGAPGYGSWFKTEGSLTRQKKLQDCVKHDNLGHIIVITSVGDKKIEGIANNHAYSMLKTYQHQGKTLFKIRNPWGRFQWNGQYGQNSSLWTPELKKLVSFEKKDDGIFYLSEAEVFEAFCYYSISQINPQFKYSFVPFTSGHREDIFFKFTLNSSTQLNLRITQPFKRMVRDSSYDHSPMIFEVGKVESPSSVKFLTEGHSRTFWGAKSVHAFQDITKNLDQGTYIVRIRMLWKQSEKYNSAVLGIYANQNVNATKISPQQGIPLWKKMLIDRCESGHIRKSGKISYKVVTMNGQFVFPVFSDSDATVTLKFDRAKMSLVDMGLGQINDHELQLYPKAGQPDVGTMVRTEPAKGGSTGQFYIL